MLSTALLILPIQFFIDLGDRERELKRNYNQISLLDQILVKGEIDHKVQLLGLAKNLSRGASCYLKGNSTWKLINKNQNFKYPFPCKYYFEIANLAELSLVHWLINYKRFKTYK